MPWLTTVLTTTRGRCQPKEAPEAFAYINNSPVEVDTPLWRAAAEAWPESTLAGIRG
jgi:hypothetical protein